jgi:hypothetical protein
MNDKATAPRVKVSVPCPGCPDPHRPHEDCPRCHGDGILLLTVDPQDAALAPEVLLRRLTGEARDGEVDYEE